MKRAVADEPTVATLGALSSELLPALPATIAQTFPLPCPFCGYAEPVADEIDRHTWAVCCVGCECIGPVSRISEDDAVRLWERRVEVSRG